jgi:hypothetical protein
VWTLGTTTALPLGVLGALVPELALGLVAGAEAPTDVEIDVGGLLALLVVGPPWPAEVTGAAWTVTVVVALPGRMLSPLPR